MSDRFYVEVTNIRVGIEIHQATRGLPSSMGVSFFLSMPITIFLHATKDVGISRPVPSI